MRILQGQTVQPFALVSSRWIQVSRYAEKSQARVVPWISEEHSYWIVATSTFVKILATALAVRGVCCMLL